MAGYIVILVATFCTVNSQLLSPIVTRDYGCEPYGPVTSSITVIDNSMSLPLASALQSMILNNFLDSSINLTPKYQNSEFFAPCSFIVESVTYSPIIDTFYPYESSFYDIHSPYDCPIYVSEPQVFYKETISYGPSPLDICFTDVMSPQIMSGPCVNSYDIPIVALPPNFSVIDLIMPPSFGGYSDVYMPGVPFLY